MAQSSLNFSSWASSSDANFCYKLEDCNSMRDSAVSTDLDQFALHHPTRIQFQRPDVLRSFDALYDSGQVLKFQSAYNELSNDLLHRITEVSALDQTDPSVIRTIPSRPTLLAEAVVPKFDHNQVEAPAKKINMGRRRRKSDGTPDGWVASKNLISERRRREKLQKGLITLRELVPMFTMKMDKVSILRDAINYLQELKRKIEMLETGNDEELGTDLKAVQVAKSSCNDLETSDAEVEGDRRKNLSRDGSFCSELSDETARSDYETSSSSRDGNMHQIKLDVAKLDHALYKLDLICMQQSGILVQLSQAIEAFVIEVVHTSIVVITSTKVTCTFIVKMSSWNNMSLEDVRVDIKKLLRESGLQFSESAVMDTV